MNRSCSKVAGTLPVGMVLAISACGQSLVEPERIPEVRKLFEAQASAPQLRCEIGPVRPALDFGFRFQAGYTADIPLVQFRGLGHDLTVYARVTPEGRGPVYMTKTEALPEVPETKVDAVTGGAFVVGEGTYGLEVLVEDDLHRGPDPALRDYQPALGPRPQAGRLQSELPGVRWPPRHASRDRARSHRMVSEVGHGESVFGLADCIFDQGSERLRDPRAAWCLALAVAASSCAPKVSKTNTARLRRKLSTCSTDVLQLYYRVVEVPNQRQEEHNLENVHERVYQ
jgi:hypothetical protein